MKVRKVGKRWKSRAWSFGVWWKPADGRWQLVNRTVHSMSPPQRPVVLKLIDTTSENVSVQTYLSHCA